MTALHQRELDLPACLTAQENDDKAVFILHKYYRPVAGETGYTGGQFDTFDPSGTRTASTNTFTSDDLIAVTLLSVSVPARAALELLMHQRRRFEGLLEELGPDREFADEPSVGRGEFTPAWDLWHALDELPGVGATMTSKLMARKRPRLIPIFDTVIDAHALGSTGILWGPLHARLRGDNGALQARLTRIRDAAGLDANVSALRVFDVLTWMEGTRNAAG